MGIKKKRLSVVGAGLFFLFAGLTFFGFFSSVKVWPNIYWGFGIVGLCISVPITALILRQTIKNEEKKSVKEVVKTSFAVLIFIPIMIHVAMAKGLPSLLHHIENQTVYKNYLVKEKTSGRGCGKGFGVAEFNQIFNNEICGISKDAYNKIDVGDWVKLKGSSSQFGFLPEEFALITLKHEPESVANAPLNRVMRNDVPPHDIATYTRSLKCISDLKQISNECRVYFESAPKQEPSFLNEVSMSDKYGVTDLLKQQCIVLLRKCVAEKQTVHNNK